MVPAGVTLDLNGQTLTVGSAASFGVIMGEGKLAVGEYALAMPANNGAYLPVYVDGGYEFIEVVLRQQINVLSTGYQVRYYIYNAEARTYLANIMANGNNTLDLVIRAEWTVNADGDTAVQDFTMNDAFEASYGANNISGRTTVDFLITGTEGLTGFGAYGVLAARVGNYVVEVTV